MPLTAPSGPVSLAIENLRVILANCTAFQSWVGAGNAATALEHIFYEALPPPAEGGEYSLAELQAYRPFALVGMEAEDGFYTRSDAQGAGFEWDLGGGRLSLWLEENVEPSIALDAAEVSRRFCNTIGAIIDELCDLSGTATYLALHSVRVLMGPGRGDKAERATQGDYVAMRLGIEWGMTGG